ncbi:transcriptional regulator [Acinetobacter sp. ANC 4779]|uniref:recombinase RecT n=1 Tax=Acinetobacter sp. ANC 4779 TaxID=2529848 RepID=UPI0010404B16|nr:recombinase RecT [Acinetobacter sp. ANC 4779]TCB51003.1 transcriptional regulator [Acinetobacter sp. ANC 4779]
MNAIVKANQNAAANFLTPTSLQEAMQIADLLAGSDIVPKDYQRKPGNILVAMQWGAEIGLQPLQALQNIAVINGRPSVWGDAMLALVRSSGLLEFIREELSDNGQEATCTVKRKGQEPVVSKFSMEDAKKAGLSGKQGPWTQYPKRMLKLRARSYALRDEFTDVLKGMAIAEEEQDKEIDITPAAVSAESGTVKANSGSSALKQRMAKKAAVDSVATEIDLTPYYQRIDNATSLDELNQIGADIAALNLGEPAKSEIGNLFKAKREELKANQVFPAESVQSVIEEINNTADLDALNAIMASRFEPFTAQMNDDQIMQINSAYEAQEAALTA